MSARNNERVQRCNRIPYEGNMKTWGPELSKRRPDITMEMVVMGRLRSHYPHHR